MHKIKVDLENMPKGSRLEVPYLGVVENGSEKEVTDIQWQRFINNMPGGQRYADQSSLVLDNATISAATAAHGELRAAGRAERGQAPAPAMPVAVIEGREGRGQPFIEPVARSERVEGPGSSNTQEEVAPLSKRNKDELIELAEAGGHDASGKNKDELIELLSQEG